MPVGEFLARVQDGDAVGEVHHDVHVVLDQEDRGGVAEAPDEGFEILDLGIGETLGRFVEDQEPRVEGEAHGDFEQSLVAVGERAGDEIGLVVQPDAGERRAGVGVEVAGPAPLDGDGDVVEDGERRIDRGDLERVGDAQTHAGMGGQAGDVAAHEGDRA